MVPTDAAVDLEFLAIIVVEVGTEHLTAVQTATVPPAGILLFVVEVAGHHDTGIVGEARGHAARGIAVLRTTGQVEVGHVATVHALLDGEVEHGLLVTVLDTRDTGLIALLVVELHVLDDGDRQVLQRRLGIAEHELLTVDEDLLHLLAVDGDVAVLIDLSSRHAFDEFLDGRALRGAVGIGIEHERVLLDDDLCSTARDDSLLEHDALRRHQQRAEFLVLAAAQGDVALDVLESDRGDLQSEGAVVRGLDGEVSLIVADGTTDEDRVGDGKQLNGSLCHRLAELGVDELAADGQATGHVIVGLGGS